MPTRKSSLMHRYGVKKRKRRGMRNPLEEMLINGAAVLLVCIFLIFLVTRLLIDPKIKDTDLSVNKVAAFAIPYKTLSALRELSVKYKIDFPELLTVYSIQNQFYPAKSAGQTKEEIEQSFMMEYDKIKKQYKSKTLEAYQSLLGGIINEIKYFPIKTGYENEVAGDYIYCDSWGAARNYEGTRTHIGCDLLDKENVRGRIPIASMTEGIIEDAGWTEQGGFRVGIRSASGNYYYYAHMERFGEGIMKGAKVVAGQSIGFMGDTGYGKKEGTTGNFPVHLHLGISPKTSLTREEFWINPYPFLRLIEETKASY